MLGDVAGLDVVELGCGTAYFSAWLARRGARPVGVDVTPAQLETARRMQRETASCSRSSRPTPARPVCPTRASTSSSRSTARRSGSTRTGGSPRRAAAPSRRAARLPAQLDARRSSARPTTRRQVERAARSGRSCGLHRVEWETEGVEFHLGHGDWIDLLHANGFELERLVELYAPEDAREHRTTTSCRLEWAQRWPCRGDLGRPQAVSGAACAAAPPRLDLAAAARDPRRSSGSRSRSSRPPTRRTPGADPLEHAAGKARSVDGGERPVLGVDTIVVCGGELIGKPRDAGRGRAHARDALRARRTRSSRASACGRAQWEELHAETTRVTFRALTPRDLAHYLASGEWEGRAGAYAIQGLGGEPRRADRRRLPERRRAAGPSLPASPCSARRRASPADIRLRRRDAGRVESARRLDRCRAPSTYRSRGLRTGRRDMAVDLGTANTARLAIRATRRSCSSEPYASSRSTSRERGEVGTPSALEAKRMTRSHAAARSPAIRPTTDGVHRVDYDVRTRADRSRPTSSRRCTSTAAATPAIVVCVPSA